MPFAMRCLTARSDSLPQTTHKVSHSIRVFLLSLISIRTRISRGLHAALAYAQSEWLLAIACDYPFLTSELIIKLSSKISDDFDAVVPRQSDGRLQPLCAFYRVKLCLKFVEKTLESKRATPPLRSIFEMCGRGSSNSMRSAISKVLKISSKYEYA